LVPDAAAFYDDLDARIARGDDESLMSSPGGRPPQPPLAAPPAPTLGRATARMVLR